MTKLVGTAPNQTPTNADLGTMAYQDSNQIKVGTIDAKGKVQATDDVRLVAATSTTRRLNSFVANNTYNLGLSGGAAIAFHRTSDNSDEIGFETHKHGNSHAERFRIGSLGQFGVGGATYGTSGQVLTSGGASAAPTWAAAGGGGTEFIASVDASDDATISFTGFDSGNFDYYMFSIQNLIPATNNTILRLATNNNGGSNYDTGSNNYRYISQAQRQFNFAGYSAGVNSDTYFQISKGSTTSNVAGNGGVSGTLQIIGPHKAAFTHMLFAGSNVSSSTQYINSLRASGYRNSAADVEAIQFSFVSGNITSGTITMYGFKNA